MNEPIKKIIGLLCLLLSTLLSSARAEIYMKIDSIPGESRGTDRTGWIDVTDWRYDASLPVTRSRSAGSVNTTERVTFSNFTVEKRQDKSSLKLLMAMANLTRINSVEIHQTKPGVEIENGEAVKTQIVFKKFFFTNVYVSGYELSAAADDGLPHEIVQFIYERIEIYYTATDPDTGEPGQIVASYWDLVHNKGGGLSGAVNSLASIPPSTPSRAYAFDSGTLEQEGIQYDGEGTVTLGDLPEPLNGQRGLILTCEPGQTVQVYTKPSIAVGSDPYNVRVLAHADSPNGVLSIGALDGEYVPGRCDFSVITTQSIVDGFQQLSVYHKPSFDTTTNLMSRQTVVIQLAAFPVGSPVTVFLEDMEIVPYQSNKQSNPQLIETQ